MCKLVYVVWGCVVCVSCWLLLNDVGAQFNRLGRLQVRQTLRDHHQCGRVQGLVYCRFVFGIVCMCSWYIFVFMWQHTRLHLHVFLVWHAATCDSVSKGSLGMVASVL